MLYVPPWAGLYLVLHLHLHWKGTKVFVLCQHILGKKVMEASFMNTAIEEIPDADRELDNIICHGKGLSIEDR